MTNENKKNITNLMERVEKYVDKITENELYGDEIKEIGEKLKKVKKINYCQIIAFILAMISFPVLGNTIGNSAFVLGGTSITLGAFLVSEITTGMYWMTEKEKLVNLLKNDESARLQNDAMLSKVEKTKDEIEEIYNEERKITIQNLDVKLSTRFRENLALKSNIRDIDNSISVIRDNHINFDYDFEYLMNLDLFKVNNNQEKSKVKQYTHQDNNQK